MSRGGGNGARPTPATGDAPTTALASVAEVVTRAGTALLWCGTPADGGGDEAAALTATIYAHAYVFGEPRPIDIIAATQGWHGTPYDATVLSAANRGAGRWVSVDAAAPLSAGRVGVRWRGVRVDAPQERLAAGRLRTANERVGAQPGFYFALGDEEIREGAPVARLYWNLADIDAAAGLIEVVTSGLAGLPFDLKVATTLEGLARADAAVLYLPVAMLHTAAPVVRQAYGELRLSAPTPLWTHTLAPGLGLAEDPLDGQSFGQQRSAQAARAILAGLAAPSDPQAAAAAAFAAAGVDPAAPHTQPASALDEAMVAALVP